MLKKSICFRSRAMNILNPSRPAIYYRDIFFFDIFFVDEQIKACEIQIRTFFYVSEKNCLKMYRTLICVSRVIFGFKISRRIIFDNIACQTRPICLIKFNNTSMCTSDSREIRCLERPDNSRPDDFR